MRRGEPVCITGMGIATSLGRGKRRNWEMLTAGHSGISAIRRFETAGLPTSVAATIDYDGLGELPFPLRAERLAERVLDEALSEARLPGRKMCAQMFIGLPPTEMTWAEILALGRAVGGGRKMQPEELIKPASDGSCLDKYAIYVGAGAALRLAERYGSTGAPVVVNTACSTGATVIELAVESIRRGHTDIAVALAADASVTPDTLVRFGVLAALSLSRDRPETVARPFSLDRDGFVMGEGAAAMVLESCASARSRGVSACGFVTGVGERSDPFHLTRSTPTGAPSAAAIRLAIADAGVAPEDIGYINAHGTGTQENDRVEGAALKDVFGSFANWPPVSSNKSMIGHTMSAAGLVEAVFSLLSMQTGVIPPTINYRVPDPELPLDVVPNRARKVDVSHALSNSFGFGGQNVALVLSRDPRR